jgi:hypothetical protein
MQKIERIRAILKGQTPDHSAYSFWTHFPGTDLDAIDALRRLIKRVDGQAPIIATVFSPSG